MPDFGHEMMLMRRLELMEKLAKGNFKDGFTSLLNGPEPPIPRAASPHLWDKTFVIQVPGSLSGASQDHGSEQMKF